MQLCRIWASSVPFSVNSIEANESLQGATVGVEDGASLAECLDRAKSVEDIPRVLKAFENLRRARAESMIELSRASMDLWHLPDGEQQRQRDAFWSKRGSLVGAGSKFGNSKPIDEPPTSIMDPLVQDYFRGHDAVDFVSDCRNFLAIFLADFGRRIGNWMKWECRLLLSDSE
jgi:hypothetical protein